MTGSQPDDGAPQLFDPSFGLVQAANAALQDPKLVASIRQMHAEGYPLVKMVEALALDDEMDDQLRAVIEKIPPDVVTGIREATLEMLDRGGHDLPLDCNVTPGEVDQGVPVEVEVVDEDNVRTIRARAKD
jgi:hypothetical protein